MQTWAFSITRFRTDMRRPRRATASPAGRRPSDNLFGNDRSLGYQNSQGNADDSAAMRITCFVGSVPMLVHWAFGDALSNHIEAS